MAAPRGSTFINLFAGGGGLLLGLQRAGFRCVGVAERDVAASKTLQAHLGRSLSEPFLALGPTLGDVRKLDFADWRRRLEDDGERLDLLAGGPPCQSFSRVGRGKLNDLTAAGFLGDERNRLWRVFFRGVEELRPRAFLVENVPGMLHHGGINVADLICAAGERLGYRTRCAILNAGSFGVPQIRERLFVIGVEGDSEPTFPMGSHVVRLGPSHIGRQASLASNFRDPARFVGNLLRTGGASAVSVAEALGDLPDHLDHLRAGFRARVPCEPRAYRPGVTSDFARRMRSWPGLPPSEEVADHVCKATPRDYKTFASMSPGDRYPAALKIARRRFAAAVGRWRSLDKTGPRPREADYVPPYRDDNFPEKWRKLIVGAPSWTVTAHLAKDSYSHIHYDSRQARMITVREAARLQSFPDSWRFEGNLGDRFRQIGNAVPPLMAAALGRHLRLLLRRQGAAVAQRDWEFVAAEGAR